MNPAPESFQELFDRALPGTQGNHVLTLGEYHRQTPHLSYLRENLPALVRDHRLGTLGLEMQPFMNVFFWAYRDGSMAQALGSQEAARDYLRTLFRLVEGHETQTATDRADLVIAALDQGVRIVAYDTRYRWTSWWNKSAPGRAELDQVLSSEQKQAMRTQPAIALKILEEVPAYKQSWVVHEAAYWMDRHPSYRKTVNGIEQLSVLGDRKGLDSDAISSLVLNAGADITRNTIAIIGMGHMIGAQHTMGNETIAGLYPEFLSRQKSRGIAAPRVTKALVAGTAVANEIHDILRTMIHESKRQVMIDPIHHADLDTADVTRFPSLVPEGMPVKPWEKAVHPHEANPLRLREMQRTVALLREQFTLLGTRGQTLQ